MSSLLKLHLVNVPTVFCEGASSIVRCASSHDRIHACMHACMYVCMWYGMAWHGMLGHGMVDMPIPCKIRGREVCLGIQPIWGAWWPEDDII